MEVKIGARKFSFFLIILGTQPTSPSRSQYSAAPRMVWFEVVCTPAASSS
jgi:hypothetical protein